MFLSAFANQNMEFAFYWQHGYHDSSHLALLLALWHVKENSHQ